MEWIEILERLKQARVDENMEQVVNVLIAELEQEQHDYEQWLEDEAQKHSVNSFTWLQLIAEF